MIYYETDYLAHHGVKGMRWGVRKQRQKSSKNRGYKKQLRRDTISMWKHGAPGSLADTVSKNKSTKVYKSLKYKKGKKYADNVVKRTNAMLVTQMIAGGTITAVSLGLLIRELG